MQNLLLELETAVPVFRTGTWKNDPVYFNSSENLVFSKGDKISAVLKHQIKALREDIRVCQSWLTFKGLVYNYRSHFVWNYKGKQVIKKKAFKNGETDIPFQVQFSPATVFATYHSSECFALKWLNRVPAEDLNLVFNEPVILVLLTQVWICWCRILCGINMGLTQSIKRCKLLRETRH